MLGWRDVPVDADGLGPTALGVMPRFRQLFVAGARRRRRPGPRAARVRAAQGRRAAGPRVAASSCTSRRCRPAPWSTRACSPPTSSAPCSPTCPTSGSRARSAWCTAGSRPTPSRRGRWRTRSATSRTTARSTPSAATATGCAPARRCSSPTSIPGDLKRLFPICTPGRQRLRHASTRCVELLHLGGRSLPHAVLMMIPEAWENNPDMDTARRDVLRVPLLRDGAVGRPGVRQLHRRHRHRRGPRPQRPAPGPLVADRRRPRRAGQRVRRAGHRPGARSWPRAGCSRAGCSSSTPRAARSAPTRSSRPSSPPSTRTASGCTPGWCSWRTCPSASTSSSRHESVTRRQQIFGYTEEELRVLHRADGRRRRRADRVDGQRHARWRCCRSARGMLFDYFTELFAQVTNPPLDAIREELVTSLSTAASAPSATCWTRARRRAGRSCCRAR